MGRERDALFQFSLSCSIAVLFVLICLNSPALGREKERDLPERGISVYPEYTGVVISQGDDVNIDLKVSNRGRRDENVGLQVTSKPDGWKVWVKTYEFGVRGVHVDSDKSKNLTLRVQPPAAAKPGDYTVGIRGETGDGKLISEARVLITILAKEGEKKSEEVNIITSYPVLKGPTDAKFEFSLEVESKSDTDSIFNLTAQGPENWDVNFKPAYEQKFISSLRLKAGQSQTVAVDVKPYVWATPGQYPVLVKVSSPKAVGEVALTVVLTGTYDLQMGTANDLLSLNAVRGEKANFSFYVKNTGSAVLNNIQILSFKPENWKVEFSPEQIESLAPGELTQAEVSVTPADRALVGDYSVGLRVQSGNPPKTEKTIEMRVTVMASAAWGWIGIGIIVLVMAGLVGIFIRLGRR